MAKLSLHRIPTESQEQQIVASYLDAKGLFWLHVPNEGIRSRRTGSRLKKEGMKAGAPDIIILESPPAQPFARGIMIEMKRVKGSTVTQNQMTFLNRAYTNGWLTCIAYGADEAIRYLHSLGL